MAIKCGQVACAWGVVLMLGGVITMITLLAMTVNKEVGQSEYMLTENKYTGALSNIHEQGRVTLAVGDREIFFTRTVQPLAQSVVCFSSDLIQVTLDVTTMWQYKKDLIRDVVIVSFYDENYYQTYFAKQIVSSVHQSCANFTAQDYYSHRTVAELRMLADLRATLALEVNPVTAIEITQLQLTNIAFPSAFDTIVGQKLNTQAQQTTSLNNRGTMLTNATSYLLAAQKQAEVTLIEGQQQSNVLLAQANATRAVVRDQWIQRGAALAAAKQSLNLYDDDSLVQYIQGELVRNNAARTIVSV